jgi:hypothetical protein
LRGRRMRRVYRHDFQKGQGDQYHQVSSHVCVWFRTYPGAIRVSC